ncbi:MAG: hypothetical protein IT422_08615 [Pirellulaceae bacterium]|jgi:probable H4MPT-linked C1 transfer pathway protein|nr:hypothetical protein [Pirellulaceae bacterium]
MLGIDIGGAHIKLANSAGESAAWYFPMWSAADELANSLRKGIDCFCRDTRSTYSHIAVTMTGEMADCFATRAAGVEFILQQLASAITTGELHVYSVDGNWLTPHSACQHPWDVAASNWHALAQWIARHVVTESDNLRIVLDIGSTTVDVIPIMDRRVATTARCDSERLRMRQLVYTGVGRTPIAAILSSATLNGVHWPLVAERFATSDDAYMALGFIPAADSIRPDAPPSDLMWPDAPPSDLIWPDAPPSDLMWPDAPPSDYLPQQLGRYGSDTDTADGRPRTVSASRARLARMLGEDCERLQHGEIDSLARAVVERQARQVAQAITENLPALSLPDERPLIMISGHGLPLARAAVAQLPHAVDCLNLSERISSGAARCAPAVAVACLLEAHLSS